MSWAPVAPPVAAWDETAEPLVAWGVARPTGGLFDASIFDPAIFDTGLATWAATDALVTDYDPLTVAAPAWLETTGPTTAWG